MKKSFLLALGLGMFAASVYAQPATTASAFRMYNSATSNVTIKASAALGTGIFSWPQPAVGIFKSDASGNMSLGAVNLNSGSGDVTGILPIANGGTGLGTLGTAGQMLAVNAGGTALTYVTPNPGTVTSFSSGNLNPLFTTSVATPTSTPALSFSLNSQNAGMVFAGPASGGPAAPTFRALTSTDIPSLAYVSSVGLGLPSSVFSVSGSPVTSTGTLTGSFVNQTANTVFAGPVSGGPAVPTFRALTPADITNGQALTETDDANVQLTITGGAASVLNATNITVSWLNQLSIARGGTNGTAAPVNGGVAYGSSGAYAFSAAGTSGQFLRSNGAAAPSWTSGTLVQARGTVPGTGTYTYTVPAGVGSLAGRQIMITFQNEGAGGLQTTYAVVSVDAPVGSFTVEFANNIVASQSFHWVVL